MSKKRKKTMAGSKPGDVVDGFRVVNWTKPVTISQRDQQSLLLPELNEALKMCNGQVEHVEPTEANPYLREVIKGENCPDEVLTVLRYAGETARDIRLQRNDRRRIRDIHTDSVKTGFMPRITFMLAILEGEAANKFAKVYPNITFANNRILTLVDANHRRTVVELLGWRGIFDIQVMCFSKPEEVQTFCSLFDSGSSKRSSLDNAGYATSLRPDISKQVIADVNSVIQNLISGLKTKKVKGKKKAPSCSADLKNSLPAFRRKVTATVKQFRETLQNYGDLIVWYDNNLKSNGVYKTQHPVGVRTAIFLTYLHYGQEVMNIWQPYLTYSSPNTPDWKGLKDLTESVRDKTHIAESGQKYLFNMAIWAFLKKLGVLPLPYRKFCKSHEYDLSLADKAIQQMTKFSMAAQ